MADDDVPPVEMSWFRSRPDAIDAALTGADADADVVAIVETLRSAYLPEEPLARSAALSAFCDAPRPAAVVTPLAGPLAAARRSSAKARVSAASAAFVATVAGKVVLGSAVAAAGLGGMHAAEVIDVPFLPDRATVVDETDVPEILPPVRSTDPRDVLPSDVLPSDVGPTHSRVPDTATDRVGDAPFDRLPTTGTPDRTDAPAPADEAPDRSSRPPAVPDEAPVSEPPAAGKSPADQNEPIAGQGEERAPTDGSAPARADEGGARAEGDGRASTEKPGTDPGAP